MERKGFIGGSDAKRILDGGWHQLWLEKMGMVEPEDLSHKFEVQLGIHTERFHIDWLCKYHGFNIEGRDRARAHPSHPFIQAKLDGWCTDRDTFVEVKHSNYRATRDTMVDWYQPQIAHYCNVTGKDSGWVSYIAGNSAPDYFEMTPSKTYREALLAAELAFWWYVDNKQPPEKLGNDEALLEAVVNAAKDVRIDAMRVVDMSGNNEWAAYAGDYLAFKDKAAAFEAAKKTLKNLVEADVRIAAGHGVIVKRSKSGSLTFSETRT